jgi:hypothetical protein
MAASKRTMSGGSAKDCSRIGSYGSVIDPALARAPTLTIESMTPVASAINVASALFCIAGRR